MTNHTHQTAPRDRIAKALASTELKPPFPHCLAMADAVLAVLPAPVDRAALVRACASFVRDTYSGEWADDAAATLETDAAKIERGEPCSLLRIAAELRRVADKTLAAQGTHAARRDAFARFIYEHWNRGDRWDDAHPDDVVAYRVDADAAMAAADATAGIPYANPTSPDVYQEVADRLTVLSEKPGHGWAATAANKVQQWAGEQDGAQR